MSGHIPRDELFKATVAAEGVTTGAGNITGLSLVDSSLAGVGVNSYVGMLAIIHPGEPTIVDSKEISAFNNVTGEVTVDSPFKGGQVAAGVPYEILTFRFIPAEIAEQIAELIASDMSLVTAFGTGSLANTGQATLASLDAISGTKKDVKVTAYLDGATVGNIEECWYLTSIAAPTTFVKKFPILTAHNPAAAAVLQREFGDVPEGLQLQYRIDSGVNNDSGVHYESEMTYLE